MRFRYRPDRGFGSELEVRIGWWNMNYSRFQDHVYVHFLWARPVKKQTETTLESRFTLAQNAGKC